MGKTSVESLTPFEQEVLLRKGTERAGTGLYTHYKQSGTYYCKGCGVALYRSDDKFESGCGWPSFDQEIAGAVIRKPDIDGRRTEIVCANCKGHLGHVFEGEGYTAKNTRHCVNSVSMKFVAADSSTYKSAIFASGCFWGTEYFLARVPGVIKTMVGYSGGHMQNPDYKSVCAGTTGHVECVEVTYDPGLVDYRALCEKFFETHDFGQENGQGPDIGSQYLSVLFYGDDSERKVAESVVGELRKMGHKVATKLRAVETFWPGEEYHRDYYERQGATPYCHSYRAIFGNKL